MQILFFTPLSLQNPSNNYGSILFVPQRVNDNCFKRIKELQMYIYVKGEIILWYLNLTYSKGDEEEF